MPSFINLPTLAIQYVKPVAMSWDEVGSSLDGGRNGLGQTQTIEISGGGLLMGRYECGGMDPEAHEYFNWLAARLNGSYRFINVPVLTDWMGPFVSPLVTGIPHSDGALFSDGSGYSQATVWGRFSASAALNAGVVQIDIFHNSRNLRWADWFAVRHAVKGWRAYRAFEFSDPVAITASIEGVSTPGQRYTARLSRPLREAVASGTRIEFARPLCAMKFPVDFTLSYEVGDRWVMRPILEFEEAF